MRKERKCYRANHDGMLLGPDGLLANKISDCLGISQRNTKIGDDADMDTLLNARYTDDYNIVFPKKKVFVEPPLELHEN